MGFSLSKLLDGMRNSYSPFDESSNEFIALNKTDAQKNLQIVERAKDNGLSNIPRANSKTKDSIAREIDSFLSQAVTLAKNKNRTLCYY